MVLDVGLWEDIERHERERIPPKWEIPEIFTLHDVACTLWATSSAHRFRRLQIGATPLDFGVQTQQFIRELTSKLSEATFAVITELGQLCEDYVERVSTLRIVRKVLLVETEDIPTIWTIIDSTPFEDSVREPIYQAQLQVLRALEGTTLLDFYVLNVSELPEDEELDNVVPANAKLLWER